jgi:hypothetical protein
MRWPLLRRHLSYFAAGGNSPFVPLLSWGQTPGTSTDRILWARVVCVRLDFVDMLYQRPSHL